MTSGAAAAAVAAASRSASFLTRPAASASTFARIGPASSFVFASASVPTRTASWSPSREERHASAFPCAHPSRGRRPPRRRSYGTSAPSLADASGPDRIGAPSRQRQQQLPERPLTLRRLSAPFLMLCHPDRTPSLDPSSSASPTSSPASASSAAAAAVASSSPTAREVNLRAVQSLNGLIDAVESIRDRALRPASSSASYVRGKIELPRKLEIEFLVPSSDDDEEPLGKMRPKPKDRIATLTRRSVVLTFPKEIVEGTQSVDGRGRYDVRAAEAARDRARDEIARLLRAAGLGPPEGYAEWVAASRRRREDAEEWTVGDYLLDEMDIDGRRASEFASSSGPRFSRSSRRPSRPMTKYEKSRRKFMDSVDWTKYRKMFDKAWDDAIKDLETYGKIEKSEERRQNLIGEVLGRVRVDDGRETTGENIEAAGDDAAAEVEAEAEARGADTEAERLERRGLGPVGQLIAIRRLSLLLEDNFSELEMEELGRAWEGLTIVLAPERDSSASVSSASAVKRRRKGRVKESGFKFTYETEGRITAHVPVDFTDDELVGEFRRHVREYWEANVPDGGYGDLLPRFARGMTF